MPNLKFRAHSEAFGIKLIDAAFRDEMAFAFCQYVGVELEAIIGGAPRTPHVSQSQPTQTFRLEGLTSEVTTFFQHLDVPANIPCGSNGSFLAVHRRRKLN
jgi:hypothetical protein